jgi:autoinducer 2-degrading protein
MIIVHVHVNVRPERLDDFIKATRLNAAQSLREPGVKRFDVFQEEDRPNHFILEEIYLNTEAANSHKDTEHYRVWRNTVNDMMAEPRHSIRYSGIVIQGE